MIVNNNLAPVTQAVTDLYWQDENNVARINRIVQFILERDAVQQSVQPTLLESGQIERSVCTCAQCQLVGSPLPQSG